MSKLAKTKEILLKFHNKRIKIPHLLSLIMIVFVSFAVNYLIFQLSPVPYDELFAIRLATSPSLLYLNWLPILLLMILLWLVSNNSPFAMILGGGLSVVLAIANQFKVTMRQDPLLPTDITLIREALSIVKSFPNETKMQFKLLFIVLALIIIASVIFRGYNMKHLHRISAIAITLAFAVFMNTFYYSSAPFYNEYPVSGNVYFPVNHYNSKGFIYSFLQNFNTMKIQKPQGYLASTYDKLEKATTEIENKSEKKPHIIMIMGEAFSDLSKNENLDFNKYGDPMENYDKLLKKDGAISGHLVVPNFGGGTSNTEYDVLTACPTRYLGNTLPSYNFVHQSFDAMPRQLQKLGYNTLALHPGYYWFYNRHNVYQSFGFENFIHLSSFDPSRQSKGGYITEAATMSTLISAMDDQIKNSEQPLFSFTVTIQNHGPYEQKYWDARKTFDSDISLSALEEDILDNYFSGLRDADREIGKLVNYMENSEEPIVLVYFGDHLPGFSNGMDFFDILDYPMDIEGDVQERLGIYETPYVIWQNESARAITPMEENVKKAALPDENILSSNYLGALLMELLGYTGLSPLYDYSNDLRKELPVMADHSFLTGDGKFVEKIDPDLQKKIDLITGWQYYKLFDQKIKN